MTYKKILFLHIFLLPFFLSAQEKYFKASLGYGIPLGGHELTRTQGDSSSYEEKIRGRQSAGKGLLFNLGYGKMWNDYFGFEINAAGVCFGKNITAIDTEELSYKKTEKYTNINITPTVKLVIPLAVKNHGFWNTTQMFARFGLVIPIINNGTIEYSEYNFEHHDFKKEKIINFFDPGFFAAVGMSASLNQRTHIFMEISGQNMNNKIKNSKIIEYTQDGENLLSSLTTAEKETRYHRKRIKDTDNLPDPISGENQGKATDKLTTITPAHNVGINFGIIYKIK